MADGERFENQKELNAKQRKNKKKREAAKLKNQEKKVCSTNSNLKVLRNMLTELFTSIESAVENDNVPPEKVPETRLENDEEKEQESIEVIEFFIGIRFLNFESINFCC